MQTDGPVNHRGKTDVRKSS
uniref:Uncharacterized protein n=1 Tax=Anguilla anguilla TaxID=7936 RepID=A0A0E9UCD7_ANGAN